MKFVRYMDSSGIPAFAEEVEPGVYERLLGPPGSFLQTGERVEPERLLAPIEPPAIYGIGWNYQLHIEETKRANAAKPLPERPTVFMKAPNSLANPGDPIAIPRFARSEKVDYEGELAVVIGRRCKNVRPEAALDHVLGYTIGNDVSARDWQLEWGQGQFIRGKSFDGFCPLGPAIVTADEIVDPQNLQITTKVDGEVRQDGSTANMIFPVAELIAYLSGSTTLLPGTVILTGTPEGVGMGRDPQTWLQHGQVCRVSISGIGTLENKFVEEIV